MNLRGVKFNEPDGGRVQSWGKSKSVNLRQQQPAAADSSSQRQPVADLGRLAHGERQRVELGMVTVADPWLILLDEPAAGMTAEEVDKIGEVITELTNFSSIIIVEHDMQFIRSIASTVTVFHQGRVLMEDNVDVVMSDPVLREIYLGKKP